MDDTGYREILKQMNYLDDRLVEYGYPNRNIQHKNSGKSIVDIVHWNNDGVKALEGNKWLIPPRPFMDMAYDFTYEDCEKFNKLIQDTLSKHKGTQAIHTVLKMIGEMTADNIREAIDTQSFKELAPSTVAKKGSDVQLIESNQVYDEATYEIGRISEGAGKDV